MKKLLELRNQKSELHTQMKQLVATAESENRTLDTKEDGLFKSLQKQMNEINESISRAEVLADNERSLISDKPETRTNQAPTNAELRNAILSPELRTATIGVVSSGGHLTVPELDRQIYSQLRENSIFRQNAMVQTISSHVYEKVINTGGTTCGWVSETDARTATDTSDLEKVSIPLNSLYAFPSVTTELMDMSDFDVYGWITSEITLQTGQAEEEAFWTGNGTKKPRGVLNYTRSTAKDATRTFGQIEELETLVSGIAPDELIRLSHALAAPYRANAKFYCSENTLETIRKMKDTDGQYIWRQGLEQNAPELLLGKVIETSVNIPDDEIIFADLARGYSVVDHVSGNKLIQDQVTQPGYIKLHASRYVGGAVTDSNAIKILKITSA